MVNNRQTNIFIRICKNFCPSLLFHIYIYIYINLSFKNREVPFFDPLILISAIFKISFSINCLCVNKVKNLVTECIGLEFNRILS